MTTPIRHVPNLQVSAEESQQAYLNILEDMQAEKILMQNQRIATFNIMEDISDSQNKLREKYKELGALKKLIQDLGLSLKTTVVIRNLVLAIQDTFPTSTNLAYVIPSSDPGRLSNIMYIHAAEPLTKSYLNDVQSSMTRAFTVLPTRILQKSEMNTWIRKKFLYEFVEGTKADEGNQQARSIFCIPLIIDRELFGMLNISSRKVNLFSPSTLELSQTMINVTTSTIARLHQLLDSEQSRIKSLVESSSNGWIMFDSDKKVTLANKAARQMTGLPEKGFYLSELIKLFTSAKTLDKDKNLLQKFELVIDQLLYSGLVEHIEEVSISKFSYEVLLNPVRDYEKTIIGGAMILHDITHIKEIDRMKTEFVSIASHQLRTPMTNINWSIEMLLSGKLGVLTTEQMHYLSEVDQSSKRMVKLINDLLNVSRIESGRMKIEPVATKMEVFIIDIISEIKPIADKLDCTIQFDTEDAETTLLVDKTLLRQVIHNFITNALRYSAKTEACVIHVGLKKDDTQYILYVKDSGIGIPKNQQKRIFQKFFRADNAQIAAAEGSGLGMYLAQMIMKAGGGNIWFESDGEGKGTTFFASIPITGMSEHGGERGLARNTHA